MYLLRTHTQRLITLVLASLTLICGILYVCRNLLWERGFEIADELGGNIFPSAILSTAATNAEILVPADSNYVGKPLSGIALRVTPIRPNSRVRVLIQESPFFAESISEFVLEKAGTEYTVYPEIVWKYDALKNNVQSTPLTFSVRMEMNGERLPVRTWTLSVRSVNECLLGYLDSHNKFHDTSVFFAAYVNEENPLIDQVLRFNAAEVPAKMGTFPQYDHPHTLARYAEVADYLGIKGKNDSEKLEGLIAALDELKAKVGIKKTIKEYGIDEKDFLDKLDDMTEQAFDDQCTGANPRYPLMSEIKQMYLNAYYGK